MSKAALIVCAIVLGACVPQLARAVPALPYIIGMLLLVAFCALPRGASRPTRLHLWLIAASWLIGLAACAALWPIDRALALGALLTGAAPTATAAPVVVAALGGASGFAAVAVLGSNLLACLAFPALLALLQGPDAPGSPWQLLVRVAPVVLAPWLLARALAHWRAPWRRWSRRRCSARSCSGWSVWPWSAPRPRPTCVKPGCMRCGRTR